MPGTEKTQASSELFARCSFVKEKETIMSDCSALKKNT
jgi:hypothetical protein